MSSDDWTNLDNIERLMALAASEPGAEISLSAFHADGKERQVERRAVRTGTEGLSWALGTLTRPSHGSLRRGSAALSRSPVSGQRQGGERLGAPQGRRHARRA